ncbi:MAG TPA: O-acetyl-ADP-ribose deacetylase [Chloroflexota bacterium]|nr:O-acetyl-ADP-ribose deacetylase [Chloroflexota bacterium]
MREITINGKEVRLVQGDITTCSVDAIGNAANSGLRGGGGVDGAIHRAGGPTIMEECRKIGGCPTGEARITTAGRLPARYVIHAVGPIYRDGKHGEPELLASAYRWSIKLAAEKGLESIALPSISTGVYGYPLSEAAPIALRTVVEECRKPSSLRSITFVLFNRETMEAYEATLEQIARELA